MDFRALLFMLMLALIELQAKQLAPGPQAIKEATASSTSSPISAQKSQKRYATKEIILYLTPSQIKSLQAGKGLVSAQSAPQPAEKQPQNDQRSTLKEHDEFVRQQFENIKAARIAEVEAPQFENLELVSHIPLYQREKQPNGNQQKNTQFIDSWRQDQAKNDEQFKSQYLALQLGDNKQTEQWALQNERQPELERDAWIPYGSVSEKNQEDRSLHEQLKQQWNRILEENRIQLKALSTVTPQQEKTEQILTQTEKPLLQLQYAPRYNDQKNAIEIEKILRQRHRQELEKQSALSQAEAIANSPPILVHQEIKVTKHRPVPVVKHVKVPVPTPVLIPVPEPYEVKVPHPYPVPLEIIKPIPVPILKKENIEVERPVPFQVEKRIPVPVTKNVFVNVDRPYYVEKLVPVEIKKEVPIEIPIRKAEKFTILRHVWEN